MPLANIPIREEFADSNGQFRNYETSVSAQKQQLVKQKHVDLRCFVNDALTTSTPMLYLDLLGMADLNTRRMVDLNGQVVVRKGENWTLGTVGPQADRNNWHGLTLACITGVNITSSVIG